MKSNSSDLTDYFKQVYPQLSSLRGNLKGKLLKQNDFEEKFILRNLEKIFLKYRGFTFRLPKPGEHVILFCSGGMDSILLWAYLMDKYKLKVIPLHFKAGKKKEDEAFEYFKSFFCAKYPDMYCDPFYFKYNFAYTLKDKKIGKIGQDLKLLFPNIIYGREHAFSIFTRPITRIGIFAMKAFEYALFLEDQKGIVVRSIFTGNMPEDAVDTRESTLTVARTTNLLLCLLLGDFRWQFTPIALEPKYLLTKKNLIEFAQKRDIPIEKTWSCGQSHRFQCGNCASCKQRRKIFTITGVPDKTYYKKPFSPYDINLHLGIRRAIQFSKSKIDYYRMKSNKNSSIRLSLDTIINFKKGAVFKKHKGQSSVSWISDKQLKQAIINETGTQILECLQKQPMSVGKLVENLLQVYPEDAKILYQHVIAFVKEGLDKYLEIGS